MQLAISSLTSSDQCLWTGHNRLRAPVDGALEIDNCFLNVVNGVVPLHPECHGQGEVQWRKGVQDTPDVALIRDLHCCGGNLLTELGQLGEEVMGGFRLKEGGLEVGSESY
jgi:hypothetical protein